jgi:hypothetical protein
MASDISETQPDFLAEFLNEYPEAGVADVMAEFDLSHMEALAALNLEAVSYTLWRQRRAGENNADWHHCAHWDATFAGRNFVGDSVYRCSSCGLRLFERELPEQRQTQTERDDDHEGSAG